jgi:hypothetical protein
MNYAIDGNGVVTAINNTGAKVTLGSLFWQPSTTHPASRRSAAAIMWNPPTA